MKQIIMQDDRDIHEKQTHKVIIKADDSFMSGWGGAKGGKSVAAWACLPEHAEQVLNWVENRSDMSNVKVVDNSHYFDAKHTHIYVVTDGHPAIA